MFEGSGGPSRPSRSPLPRLAPPTPERELSRPRPPRDRERSRPSRLLLRERERLAPPRVQSTGPAAAPYSMAAQLFRAIYNLHHGRNECVRIDIRHIRFHGTAGAAPNSARCCVRRVGTARSGSAPPVRAARSVCPPSAVCRHATIAGSERHGLPAASQLTCTVGSAARSAIFRSGIV